MTEENATNPYGGDYVWPSLYDEIDDMALLSSLFYRVTCITDALRKAVEENKEFVGLDVVSATKSSIKNSILPRSLTPAEIRKLIDDNSEYLAAFNPYFRGEKLEQIYSMLDLMEAKVYESDINRPLTIEEIDDEFQKKEIVYGITLDHINKRITVVYRGTVNTFATRKNWLANLSIRKKKVLAPEALKDFGDGTLSFHTGFHEYLFEETEKTSDAKVTRKYDQILHGVRDLLRKYPDFKIYVTGHSLGAAVSTITAIYFACESDLPKPISCINVASPRNCGKSSFNAVHHLEKTKKIRLLRGVNEDDLITTAPSIGYHHVGFQVTTHTGGACSKAGPPPPEIMYMNPDDGYFKWMRKSWSNSMFTNLNASYDHNDYEYTERIYKAKIYLEKQSLNELYSDESVVGFKLIDTD